MHNQPGRFVDHKQRFVLEHNVETHRLCACFHGRLSRRHHRHGLTARHSVLWPRYPRADVDGSGQQPGFHPAARILRKHPCQREVQSQTGEILGHCGDMFFWKSLDRGSLRYNCRPGRQPQLSNKTALYAIYDSDYAATAFHFGTASRHGPDGLRRQRGNPVRSTEHHRGVRNGPGSDPAKKTSAAAFRYSKPFRRAIPSAICPVRFSWS